MRSLYLYFSLLLQLIGFISLLFFSELVTADWHGDLSFRSEYVYRGYSKSRGNPVIQADFHFQAVSGWLFGAGISQVSFDDHKNANYSVFEARPYLAWNLTLNTDWHPELSVSGYIYDHKVYAKDVDYVEFSAALHYQDWLSGRIFLAPDAYQSHATVNSYELNFRHALLDTVQISAGVGYSQAMALLEQNYFYWNMGVSWFLTQYLAIDMRYVDAQLNPYSDPNVKQDEFYPSVLKNNYLLSITVGY